MLRQRRMVGKVARIGERGARIAEVVGASCIRCSLLFRLATVKWTLPSALSADGETVAALAVHIDEAELKAESSCGAAWAACRITCSSLPETHFTQQTQIRPRLRRQNALHEAAIGRLSFYTAPAAPPFRVRDHRGYFARLHCRRRVRRSGASGRPAIKVCFKTRHMSSQDPLSEWQARRYRRRKRQRIADQRGHRPHSSRRRTTLPRDGCRRRPPAKRRFTRCAGQRLVPVDDPGSRLVRQLIKLRRIAGDQPDGRAIAGLIGEANRLREAVVTDNRQQRAKVLFIRHLNTGDVDDPRVSTVERGSGWRMRSSTLPPSPSSFAAPPACSAQRRERSPRP